MVEEISTERSLEDTACVCVSVSTFDRQKHMLRVVLQSFINSPPPFLYVLYYQ